MHRTEQFLNFLRYEKRYSTHTVTAYSKDLDQFISFGSELIGGFCLPETDHQIIRRWIISLMDDGVKAMSVKRKISTLRSYFKFMIREGVITTNPMERVVMPRTGKKLPHFVQEEEMAGLLDGDFFTSDFEGVRNRAIVSLFYGTGIRLSELKGIRMGDLQLGERIVKVLGKRNKERLVPFPEEIATDLRRYLTLRNEHFETFSGYLFVTEKGEQVYDKLLYRVVRRYLGLVTTMEKRGPHILRHSYATHLLNRGAEINAIKELLGHASLAATQVYTHTTFEKLKQIYNKAHPRA